MNAIHNFFVKSKLFTFMVVNIIWLTMITGKLDGRTNYYFSSSKGDDSRTAIQAQNPSTPWQTLEKLKSVFLTVSPGDSILFKRGDIFYGTLEVLKSGTNGNPIAISAYGSGPRPVISGFSVISKWTTMGNNIYEALVPNKRESINSVVINGIFQPIGRYPKATAFNGGFLNFESHSGDGQITDIQLSDNPNWTGGEIVIRKNHWILDRTLITSHSGNVINFTPVTTFYRLIDRSGYFIQNHPSALTLNGEWCYDKSSKKIKIFYSTMPPDVKVSTVDELLIVSSKNYIKISNISFEGANVRAVNANNVMSMSMDNCSLDYSGIFAAQFNQMSGDFQFNDNTVSNSLNNGVAISSRAKDSFCTIRNNTVSNTGMIAGMGRSGDGNYMGVNINSENGALIEYNVIKNTGYVPLNFNGNNILIKNNIIDNYLMVKQDGAGIYTWNGGNPIKQKHNRVVKGNIVSNGIGNAFGTIEGKPGANGIYMDNNVINVEIIDNIVYNVSGKGNHHNSPAFVTIKGNTFFNVGSGFNLVRWVNDGTRPENGGQDITNMDIQNNIFFTTSVEHTGGRYSDRGLNFPTASTIKERISSMGIFDNNYYHLPNELGFGYSYQNDKSGPYVSSPPLSFEGWKALTGYEKNGKLIPTIPTYKLNKLISDNLYSDGQFSGNISGVKSSSSSENYIVGWDNASKITGAGSLKVAINAAPASPNDYVLLSAPIGSVSPDKNYILRFSTLGTTENGIVSVCFGKTENPGKNLSTAQMKPFGTSKVDHEFLIKAPSSEKNASWVISIFKGSGTTYIDNVQVYEANVTDININDRVRFEVNASKVAKTIDLGSKKYSGIDGTQYKGSITLDPFTSKILILN